MTYAWQHFTAIEYGYRSSRETQRWIGGDELRLRLEEVAARSRAIDTLAKKLIRSRHKPDR
jgi:hypothetical protein